MSQYKWWEEKFHSKSKEILKEISKHDQFLHNIEKQMEIAESPEKIVELLIDAVIKLRRSNVIISQRVAHLEAIKPFNVPVLLEL
jgi:hypothetical protein